MGKGTGNMFLFLMDLAWRCRYSLPILLSCSIALIGQACVLHINISTHTVRENQADSETSSEASDTSSA